MPTVVSKGEREIANIGRRKLVRITQSQLPQTAIVQVTDQDIEIPASALRLLVEILTNMAQGKGSTIIANRSQLTTQQAADLLNVSRPYLIELVERGELLFHKVGSHRRIFAEDLIAYKEKNHKARHSALQDLTDISQELELGY